MVVKNKMELLLNESIKSYYNKSRLFNSKLTVLICQDTELLETIETGKNYNLRFDYIECNSDVNVVLEKYGNSVNYFITNRVISTSIYNLFLRKNIDEKQIYVGFTRNEYFDLYEKRNLLFENLDKISEVYHILSDDDSRRIFLNIITRLCVPYQYHYYYEPENFIQYLPSEFKFTDKEVYLDAGVCDGENIHNFLRHVNGIYKQIYAFEPDHSNFELCSANLQLVSNIELFNLALYSHKCDISFHSSNLTGKKGNARIQPNGDIIVKTYDGDSLPFVPTYVKMDIEGSEKEALLGLRKCIRYCAPKLAICIYHFQKDFWEIPLIIKKLNPKYKLMIRNHEHMSSLLETVCYAYV